MKCSYANITTKEPLSKQKDNMNTILLTDLCSLRVILNQLSHKCPSSGPIQSWDPYFIWLLYILSLLHGTAVL